MRGGRGGGLSQKKKFRGLKVKGGGPPGPSPRSATGQSLLHCEISLPKGACKRTQQLPTLLRQQCWEFNPLRPCWQWCANGFNNSQKFSDLQCVVGRIQPISLCKPCVMSVRGPNNVGRAVQTNPTLLRYASAITEQKKYWELLAEKFDRFQTLRNNKQQHPTTCNRVCKRTQHVTANNAGSCWSTMLRPFARSLTPLPDYTLFFLDCKGLNVC